MNIFYTTSSMTNVRTSLTIISRKYRGNDLGEDFILGVEMC